MNCVYVISKAISQQLPIPTYVHLISVAFIAKVGQWTRREREREREREILNISPLSSFINCISRMLEILNGRHYAVRDWTYQQSIWSL